MSFSHNKMKDAYVLKDSHSKANYNMGDAILRQAFHGMLKDGLAPHMDHTFGDFLGEWAEARP